MSKISSPKWSPLKKFASLYFLIYYAFEILPSYLLYFIGNTDGYYYPSFFVQNYILKLHEVPRWTHELSRGSDTLDDWVQHLAYMLIALVVALLWTLISKRTNYETLLKWTKIGVRYYLGPVMLFYGLDKLFLNQMVYPKLSYFYTPLGDFYPMDLVWTFVGYSSTYQFIGGLLEFLAGFLILFRKTLLIGLLIFIGVMSQVLMYNYLYGVGVKSYSTVLVIMGLFLIAEYIPRLIDFLILGKSTKIEVPRLVFSTPWKKWTRIILKYGFILYCLVTLTFSQYQLNKKLNDFKPILIEGAYDVHGFEMNGKTNNNYFDAQRWNQIIVNKSIDGKSSTGHISLGTTKRELTHFKLDSLNRLTVTFIKDSVTVFKGKLIATKDSLIWNGYIDENSLQLVLKRNKRALPLHERPFRLINPPNGAENLKKRL